MVESFEVAQRALLKRLGRNIAGRRKALGLTQVGLAERLGIEPESVSRCERGVTSPSLMLLQQLASVMQVTVAELLAEYPAETYSEAQRLSALLSDLAPDQRTALVEIVEKLCVMLADARDR